MHLKKQHQILSVKREKFLPMSIIVLILDTFVVDYTGYMIS